MSKQIREEDLIELNKYEYEIPQSFRSDMRVPARIFMHKSMFKDIEGDRSLEQLVNVATLPGITQYALAMPDIHQGYGFPIGGVAATCIDEGGVISPGGIGYDINCGVRLLASSLHVEEIRPYLDELATQLHRSVPSGVGRGGLMRLSVKEMNTVLQRGAQYLLERDIGNSQDIQMCEEEGVLTRADPKEVSAEAKERGLDQLGTLGSGNHFLEVQVVDEVYDELSAHAFGLERGAVTVMVHCGSRGLGHQVCTDYISLMMRSFNTRGYQLPDRELVCAPFVSDEGQRYFSAMCAASNFAWANRHLIGHQIREAWQTVFGQQTVRTVYDVSHNIGKQEVHQVGKKELNVLVHRKGATRSFGPHTPGLPAAYASIGQPVLIPGTMGTHSYVLAGTNESMKRSFGSCCHGAGRRLSRVQAKKEVRAQQVRTDLQRAGIIVRCDSNAGLVEEAPIAYKDIQQVVAVVEGAQLARAVARLSPLVVVKGG